MNKNEKIKIIGNITLPISEEKLPSRRNSQESDAESNISFTLNDKDNNSSLDVCINGEKGEEEKIIDLVTPSVKPSKNEPAKLKNLEESLNEDIIQSSQQPEELRS